jgi:hypothetical protein
VSHTPSHISPKKPAWVLRRKVRDAISTSARICGEVIRGRLFRLLHPLEARRTQDSVFLVYTMGKVASMSVYHSITRRLPHTKSFAMHYMMPESLARQEDMLKESIYRTMHTEHALKIQRCLDRHPGKEIRIITMVRDPLSQVISDVFQHLSYHRLEELNYPFSQNKQLNLNYPEEWIRTEIIPFSGIDLLQEDFDPVKGFAIYKKGRYAMLVMRYEDLGREFGPAMEAFTGAAGWRLAQRNRSSDKAYWEKYIRFREDLKAPGEVIDRVYGSEYVRHFYTPDEIERFRERWGRWDYRNKVNDVAQPLN